MEDSPPPEIQHDDHVNRWLAYRFEVYAERFFETLIADADKALASVKTDLVDRYQIYVGRRCLEEGFRGLTAIQSKIREDGRDSEAEPGFCSLWQLLGGAYIVGTHGSFTETIRTFIKSGEQSERGNSSAIARQKIAEDTWQRFTRTRAIEIRNKNDSIRPDAIADKIRGENPSNVKFPSFRRMVDFVRDVLKQV